MTGRDVKIIFFLFCFCFFIGNFCLADSDVVFNEICWMGDEDSSSNEWIELKNNTSKDIDLMDWIIEAEDGSPIIDLEGTIPKGGIFLLERTDDNSSPVTADLFYTGALGNSGENLKLKNAEGSIIDEANFSESWGSGDNITKQTMELINNDWQTSLESGGTPGQENSSGNIQEETSDEEETGQDDGGTLYYETDDIDVPEQLPVEKEKDYKKIVISEVFPNPQGDDRRGEFIEIKNIGNRSVGLKNWTLQESGGQKYVIKDDVWIKPGRNLAIYRQESGLILNNKKDKILLFSPERKTAVDKVDYGEYDMSWSYALTAEKDWVWTKQPTPGSENVIIKKNLPPDVVCNIPKEMIAGETAWFEASDSVDPENDELEFVWNFGDGVEVNLASPSHTYLLPGEYIVTLTITDGINTVNQEEKISVFSKSGEKKSRVVSRHISRVVVNEVLPNPSGRDSDEEFIEIKNIGEKDIDIYGWSIDDEEGGSKPYIFDSHILLSPGLIMLLSRAETGIALNNDGDEIRILDKQNNVVFQTKYSSAPEGQSWTRGENDKFFWIINPSPGMENEINIADNSFYNFLPSENNGYNEVGSSKDFQQASLDQVKNFSIGDKIKIFGTVAVEPGVLASQYFYITGSPGLQIYNYYKDFPDLKTGDVIEVSGEISKVNGEKRLKTKEAGDIVVLYIEDPPQPQNFLAEELELVDYGELVLVSGQVVEKQGPYIYLDDGTGEIEIYIKPSTGIGISFVEEGDNLSVSGLVSGSNSGKIIMPRYRDDVQKTNESGEVDNNSSLLAGVNVAEAKSDWVLPARDAKKEFLSHVLILLLSFFAGFSIWKWRKRKS